MLLLLLCLLGLASGHQRAISTLLEADPLVDPMNNPRGPSDSCVQAARLTYSEARAGAPWALNLVDASAKLPASGLLYGDIIHLGNFEQCMSARGQHPQYGNFSARYCLVTLREDNTPSSHIALRAAVAGVCLPSLCQPWDFGPLINSHIIPQGAGFIANVAHPEMACTIRHDFQPDSTSSSSLSSGYVVGLTIFFLVTVVSALSVLFERRWSAARYLSVRAAWRGLVGPPNPRPCTVHCLHGLRVLSLLWVVLGHRALLDTQNPPLSNLFSFAQYMRHPLSMLIGNAFLAVDTFFLMSGLLVGLNFLRAMKNRVPFRLFRFYAYRYLRVAVPLGYVILIYSWMFPLLGNGPLWKVHVSPSIHVCRQAWWTNMLFINNYIYGTSHAEGCLGHTWHLAVDMQLFLLSPLLLLPLHYTPRVGKQLLSLCLLISCLVPFGFTYMCDFPMSNVVPEPHSHIEGCNFAKQVLQATQSRATPYLLGIGLAQFLSEKPKGIFQISKRWVMVGWTACCAVGVTIIFSLSLAYQPEEPSSLAAAFYAGFHRLGWSLCVAWIVLACHWGFGGVVNSVLSSQRLLPLSRLSYAIFLTHTTVHAFQIGVARTSKSFSTVAMLHGYLGDLAPVLLVAATLHLKLEAPLLRLLHRPHKPHKK